jgi:multiple sugar transport system ATP-binding protein
MRGAGMSGIEVRNVSKSFGTFAAVKDVSITVQPGEFVSLVGPSGCGKTTLMRMIAGLERSDNGAIRIGPRDVTSLRAVERNVAMVFQNYALYPHLTVGQNLAVPLAMRRLSALERLPLFGNLVSGTRERRKQILLDVKATADLLSIGHLLDRKPAQLSGGQRQRVALGRAIVRQPDAFLMDEPLSNLDAALRVQTRKEIVELHRRVGASTLYVTHDQAEAMTMSDRVAVMMNGRILQIATPQDVYLDPSSLDVATFVGSPRINLLPASVQHDGIVRVGGVSVGMTTRHRGDLTFALRPEDTFLDRHAGLPVRIEHQEFLGEAVLFHVRFEPGGIAMIVRAERDAPFKPPVGTQAYLQPAPNAGFLFAASGERIVGSAVRELREAAHV